MYIVYAAALVSIVEGKKKVVVKEPLFVPELPHIATPFPHIPIS